MGKLTRKIAEIAILTGVMLGAPAVSANYADGFHITQINEGRNILKMAWDMEITDWANPEYRLTNYHVFWGEVNDRELPEMLERMDGVTTFAKGADGATRFANPYEQVEFVAPTGVNLADNSGKILSYVVKMEARRPGLTDKIVAGRVDYKRCIDSIGYTADGKIFCARDEYAGGRSFYSAYNEHWQKLEPATEVRYVERVVEVPTEVPVEIEKLVEKEVPVEVIREVPTEVIREVLRDKLVTEVKEGVDGFGESTETSATGKEGDVGDGVTEVVEVPKLGGKSSNLGWLLGLMGLGSIGALGFLFWFIFPVILGKRKKPGSSKKHK